MKKLFDDMLFAIKNKTFFRHLIYSLFFKNSKNYEKREKIKRKLLFNYRCNPDNPRTFNEYLQWIKCHYRNDIWKRCADKITVKDFLIENGFEQYVPKTLFVYDNSSQIDLNKLPDKFVLKTNHDSGSVFVCTKGVSNFDEIFSKLDKSIGNKYSNKSLEWFYEDIEPKIFVEEYLDPIEGSDLVDYKFFTFNGKFRFGFTAQNRKVRPRFTLFEPDFKIMPTDYIHLRPKKKDMLSKPDNFEEMVKLSEAIGSLFDFVRVDLYATKHGIKVGELTFASMSGFGVFTKNEYDFKYGEYFKDTIFYGLSHKE